MKKILASLAAIVAISALSIAASAEGGLGNASFEEEATTVGAVMISFDTTDGAVAATTVDTASEDGGGALGGANPNAATTADGGAPTLYNADTTIVSTVYSSAAPEGVKVSTGVAEVIVPVLAVAGAVAFIVSRKK